MRMRKVLTTLSVALLAVMVLTVVGRNVFAQKKYVPPMLKKERVERFIERVKKGDRKIFSVVTYSDLQEVIEKVYENAQNNGRNFSDELTGDWKAAVRQRVVQSILAGLTNKDPRVRLVAINWLRRLRPDGSMARAVKQSIAIETVASEVEKNKIKDLDLHDSGFVQDPDALWKPEDEIFNNDYREMSYCGRTYWDGGDVARSGRAEWVDDENNPRRVDHLSHSRTADQVKPLGEGENGEVAWKASQTEIQSGRPDHAHTATYDEENPVDSDQLDNWTYDDGLVENTDPNGIIRAERTVEDYYFTKYVAKTAWLDQGRWNSERSNKVHPAFLDDRGDEFLGVLGYRYRKVLRVKGEEELVDAYDDVWDELNKLDLYITRDVWAKKVKSGDKNALRIISKDTFFSLCRRIDGEPDEYIPMFSTRIFGETEVDVLIVGLLQNRVVSTRYQCALTLARIYREPNVASETRAKIRKSLRLARKKSLLVDLDKGKEFTDWMEIDLDRRNKRISHEKRHNIGDKDTYTEDDEIDTSVWSVEVPVTQDVVDFVYRTKAPVKQYNDYTEISTWDFDPMGTVSLKKDISGVIRGYIPAKTFDGSAFSVPGEPKWMKPVLDKNRHIYNYTESKEALLFETESLSGKPYVYSGAIKHLNRFQGYKYQKTDDVDFTLTSMIEKVKGNNIISVPGATSIELVSGTLQEKNGLQSQMISSLSVIRKLVGDFDNAYEKYDYYKKNPNLTGANDLQRYEREMLLAGNEINATIKRLFETEKLFYGVKLREDKDESFLYDLEYSQFPAEYQNDDATGQLYREWIMGRIQERMTRVYPEIRWIQLTRSAMHNYVANRIAGQVSAVQHPNKPNEAINFLQFNVRDLSGAGAAASYAEVTSAEMRLPVFPTPAVTDGRGSFSLDKALAQSEYQFIKNYVEKNVDSLLQQKVGNEYKEWMNADVTPRLDASSATGFSKYELGENSVFFKEDTYEGYNAICGLADEVEKRNIWIDENKEKILHYKSIIEDNDKAHDILVALRTGDRKMLRICDYRNLKEAFLMIMLQSGIVRYDVDIEQMNVVGSIYQPTAVRAGGGLEAYNDIQVIAKDNVDSNTAPNQMYNDVFGFFRSYIGEKGTLLRLAYSDTPNKVIEEVAYGVDNRFSQVKYLDRFRKGNGSYAKATEVKHVDFVPDMYGTGLTANIKTKYDELWTRNTTAGGSILTPKPTHRQNILYNGVNDDRSNWSARDELFMDWLLGASVSRMRAAGNAAKTKRYTYKDQVTKAVLGGLLNTDPRVRLAAVHLLRRIGPSADMKGDVELALQKETVDEKKEKYLLGEKKFVNYLDVYGKYQFKNVFKELQKLHAFILRQEMVAKIKKADNEKYLAELPYKNFRILSHQIDRESWWRVPLGIDPEPDARYMYQSVCSPWLIREINDTSLMTEERRIPKVLTIVAGGIENYYFNNQVESASWLTRLWDEAMLNMADNRNKDIKIVLKETGAADFTPGNILRYEKMLKFQFWTRTKLSSSASVIEPGSAEAVYYANRVGRENEPAMNDETKNGNGTFTAQAEFTAYEMEVTPVFADTLAKSKEVIRKAVKKGDERDIIVPFRQVRGQENNFRDVVVIEDGYPDQDRTLRLNNEGEWASAQEWFFVDPADNTRVIAATDGKDTYVLEEDKDSSAANNACFIFGTKYVVASPTAVLYDPKYYDQGTTMSGRDARGNYVETIVETELVKTLYKGSTLTISRGVDSQTKSAVNSISRYVNYDTEQKHYYEPGAFGLWAVYDLAREDDYHISNKKVGFRDIVYYLDQNAGDIVVDKTKLPQDANGNLVLNLDDLAVIAVFDDKAGAAVEGRSYKDVNDTEGEAIVEQNVKYDIVREVWVVSGNKINNYVVRNSVANKIFNITLYFVDASGNLKKFAQGKARK